MEYRLLEKTELWIYPLQLTEADLGACARAVSFALKLKQKDIIVTDAAGNHLVFDILVPTIKAEQIISKKKTLLNALAKIPGIFITDRTEVHSDGVLGLISLEKRAGKKVLQISHAMGAQIAEHLRKRVMIFATGKEVLTGQIRNTNTPFLFEVIKQEGYQVVEGPILKDNADLIARAFRRAVEEGYGILITTGGIGAESKDQTIEALAQVDPQAEMPYILKFQKGQGRHNKEGVRIGVGILEQTLIVCLPGPHDEVCLSWPVLKQGLRCCWDKEVLAMKLADALRHKFIERTTVHQSKMRREN